MATSTSASSWLSCISCPMVRQVTKMKGNTEKRNNLKRKLIQKNLFLFNETFSEENLKQIFRVFDINNDGTITLKVSLELRDFPISWKIERFCTICDTFLLQELQKIVKDLFLLINETNADKASQEVLVKTGVYHFYLLDRIYNLNIV